VSLRPVRIYGDPVLRQRAHEVDAFDDTLRQLVADMQETMHAHRGVGLAANQVGVLQRVLVADVPVDEPSHVELVLVNPVLSERSGSENGEEGCLSIPGLYDEVRRPTRLRVRARDALGQPLDFVAEGYVARVIEHEVDHLEGRLFVDRLSMLKRQFLRRQLDALARGELPEGHPPPAVPGGAI